MSSYIYKLKWNNTLSTEYDLICDVSFDGNVGETDSYLSRESVFTQNYRGSKRNVYHYGYSDILSPAITFMKSNFEPFSFQENRRILSWLTGSRKPCLLEIYEEENIVKYCLIGNFTEIQQYKQDSQIIGYLVTFESNSPFAYSDVIEKDLSVDSVVDITLYNGGDDSEDLVYPVFEITQGEDIYFHVDSLPSLADMIPDVIYHLPDDTYHIRIEGDTISQLSGIFNGNIEEQAANGNTYGKYYYCPNDGNIYKGSSVLTDNGTSYIWQTVCKGVYGAVEICNLTTGKRTYLRRLHRTEKAIIDGSNQVIVSSWENRVFGNDFNWEWAGLIQGENALSINGNATIKIKYRIPIKCGDM